MHKISAHYQLVHISQHKHITKRPTAFLSSCRDATWEILSPRLPAHARVCSRGLLVVFASTAGKGSKLAAAGHPPFKRCGRSPAGHTASSGVQLSLHHANFHRNPAGTNNSVRVVLGATSIVAVSHMAFL